MLSGANPSVLRNRICDGQSAGIHVAEEGRGLFKDNHVSHNTKSGVVVNSGGTPTLIGNRICDGHSAGVLFYDSGGGTFVGNDVNKNAMGGFVVRAMVR